MPPGGSTYSPVTPNTPVIPKDPEEKPKVPENAKDSITIPYKVRATGVSGSVTDKLEFVFDYPYGDFPVAISAAVKITNGDAGAATASSATIAIAKGSTKTYTVNLSSVSTGFIQVALTGEGTVKSTATDGTGTDYTYVIDPGTKTVGVIGLTGSTGKRLEVKAWDGTGARETTDATYHILDTARVTIKLASGDPILDINTDEVKFAYPSSPITVNGANGNTSVSGFTLPSNQLKRIGTSAADTWEFNVSVTRQGPVEVWIENDKIYPEVYTFYVTKDDPITYGVTSNIGEEKYSDTFTLKFSSDPMNLAGISKGTTPPILQLSDIRWDDSFSKAADFLR